MLIREALREDAPHIAEVHVASWRSTYQGLLPDDLLANLSVERRTAMWLQAATAIQAGNRSCLFVVEDEQGRIIGFANGGPEREESAPFDSELYAIYLLAEHQARGLGRRLVSRVVSSLLEHGHSSMRVWVLKANPAERFYRRLGGVYFEEKQIDIGGRDYVEVAYGWSDMAGLR